MNLTGKGLADYATSKLGTPYFYGSKMDKLTRDRMDKLHFMYPGVVTKQYMSIAEQQGQIDKINVDCSGLIGAYRQRQIGSAQLYSTAKKRLPISQIKDFAIGTVLWKQGHVGVYVGNGECVEAKGIRYGTVKNPVKNTKWLYGLTFADMEYDYSVKVPGNSKQKNPFVEPTQILKKGSRGEGVMWLQYELNESGYGLTIDGIFGEKTLNAVIAFQTSSKILIDGEVGKQTRAALKII